MDLTTTKDVVAFVQRPLFHATVKIHGVLGSRMQALDLGTAAAFFAFASS